MKNNFDQPAFIELLKQAIGSRMKKDFASLVGIDPSHLSRILNNKYTTPPSVDTLKKIAACAEGNITYQELLKVCGYIGEAEQDIDFSVPANLNPSIKYAKATILTALESSGLAFDCIMQPEDTPFELVVNVSFKERMRWYFLFLSHKSEELMRKQRLSNYLHLLFQKTTCNDKFSFVTCLPEEYALYTEQLPNNLNANVSIILIDETHLDIQKEAWLSRASSYHRSLEKLILTK